MKQLSNELRAELFSQESGDPFLMLVTLTHESFQDIYLVDNTVNITSRGVEYTAFPMEIILPPDDGVSARESQISFSNVGLELINELRSVKNPVGVKIEMVLASNPDQIQIEINDLRIRNITYDQQVISAKLYVDDFLSTEMASEKYTPKTFPGIF